jgi:signal transduction histidine kinase
VHRPAQAVMGVGRALGGMGLTRRRIAVAAGSVVLLVAGLSVILAAPAHPQAVQEGAVAALLVAAAGTAVVLVRQPGAGGPDLAALVAVGVAGAVLAGLLPQTQAYLIGYLALAGLGLRASLRTWAAIAGALAVFAAMNVAYLLVANGSITGLITQDIGLVFIFAFVRATRLAEERALAAHRQAEILLAELRASQGARAEAAALAERSRLAREIHDVLAHALSGLVLALDTMELLGRQPDPGRATVNRMLEQVSRAQRIARDGLDDTRRAIAALRGDAMPGPALLDQLVRDTATATGISGRLTVCGTERPLPPEIGLTLYRTAQEALTNTARYAGRGAAAEVRLSYSDDAIDLVIEDQGATEAGARTVGLSGGGYGLTGMRERAELLGGSLTARPTDTGFAVRLRLPAEPARLRPAPAQMAPARPDGS